MWNRRTEDKLIHVSLNIPYKTQFKIGDHFIIGTSELLQNSLVRILESNNCISNMTTLYSTPPPNEEYTDNHFLLQHQTAIPVSN
jgi:hypothetical protein